MYNTEGLNQRSFSQQPNEPSFYNNPYSLYSTLHERGGPMFWENYGFWCLTEFEAVNAALKDPRFARLPPPEIPALKSAPHLQDFGQVEQHSLLQLEPPTHTRLRKRVNNAFITRQVHTMEEDIEALVNNCIDKFIDARHCDLLSTLATPVPVTVIARMLGVPLEHKDDLLRWSHDMVKVYAMTQSYADEIAANNSAAEFRDCLVELILRKRSAPEDDLLSLLACDDDPDTALSNEEIVSVAVLLLNAGHEATVHQFGNLIHTLLKHDCAPRGGFKNLTEGKRTVEEGLRFDAPLHMFLRYAQTDVELAPGLTLRSGEQVALLLGAANRDPKRFAQPDTFWPDRTDGAHVSLGAGIHFCIGATLARLELRILTDTLFRRLPELQLAKTPHYRNSFHFHGLEQLQVKW